MPVSMKKVPIHAADVIDPLVVLFCNKDMHILIRKLTSVFLSSFSHIGS